MRCVAGLVGLSGLLLASPAQSARFVKLAITADVTNVHNYDNGYYEPIPEPLSEHLGLRTFVIEGEAFGKMDFPSGAFVQPLCEACISTTIEERSLSFEVDPAFVHTHGGTVFALDFDHALNGDLWSATPETFVSGRFSSISSGGMLFNTFTGPITSFSISSVDSVPEPTSWMMMIAGFAGIGGALRRNRGWKRPAAV